MHRMACFYRVVGCRAWIKVERFGNLPSTVGCRQKHGHFCPGSLAGCIVRQQHIRFAVCAPSRMLQGGCKNNYGKHGDCFYHMPHLLLGEGGQPYLFFDRPSLLLACLKHVRQPCSLLFVLLSVLVTLAGASCSHALGNLSILELYA